MKGQTFFKLYVLPAACWLAASPVSLREAAAQDRSAEASSGQALWATPGAPSDIRPAARVAAPALRSPNSIGSVTGHWVRVAYIIPTNRNAQTHAVASLRRVVHEYQDWYRGQMARNGFGAKTFRCETESDGVTPRIHTVHVAETDAYLRGDLWGRTNFDGNLMGNGLRGWRGALNPARYPADDVRAAYGSALALNVSRYFNSAANFTDNTAPSLSVTTTGTNTPANGLLQLNFTASDAGGLSAAWLIWKGDLVGEMALAGASVARTFSTPYYDPGQANQYTISVFDSQGNRRNVDATIIPRTGFNRAPQPFIKVTPPAAVIGQDVVLDASQSTDPDHSLPGVQVEWDLNGDGMFDTAPTTAKLLTTNLRIHRAMPTFN